MNLPALLQLGEKFQQTTDWIPPTKRAKQTKEEEPAQPATGSSEPAVQDAGRRPWKKNKSSGLEAVSYSASALGK